MLISSMEQLNYYPISKDNYLEIDTSGGYPVGQPNVSLSGLSPEEGSPTYGLNEENSPKNGTKSSLYKTELCKRFSEFGSCRYGAKCQFAHGIAELRHVVRHPKYKTTKCKSYWGSGHCPYGSRCRFIHEETESLTQPQYSPPGTMSGMFLHEKSPGHLAGGLGVGELGVSPNGGYLYGHGAGLVGAGNGDHAGLPAYQKDYSLLSPFDKSATTPTTSSSWGAGRAGGAQQTKLSYTGEPFGTVKQAGSSQTGSNNGRASGGGYPDLQDAIEALVKFSLSPGDEPTSPVGSLGTINSSPLETLSTTNEVTGRSGAATSENLAPTKADYSLESDELWKDFPSLSGTSDFGEKQWPTGLSLNLDGPGLFGNGLEQQDSPSTKKDETSPRLSVFERFH